MGVPRQAIETQRLRLEPIALRHAADLQAAVAASAEELQPWLPFAHEPPAEAIAFARLAPTLWRRDLANIFCIVREGQALGTVGIRRSAGQIGEVGYWLRSDFAGQGLATEAVRAVVDFGFDSLGLERLELVAGIENHASNRVAMKVGFRQEGVMRSAGFTPERRYDCYLYGLLRTDRRSGLAQHEPDQLLHQVDQE